MTDETPLLQSLHSCFCSCSGRHVPLSMQRLYVWQEWRTHGWNQSDLETVIRHIRKLISERKRWDSSLRFEKVVQDSERFGEDLAEAKALSRTKTMPAGKSQVLTCTGRSSETEQSTAVPISNVIAASKALEEFLKFKASL